MSFNLITILQFSSFSIRRGVGFFGCQKNLFNLITTCSDFRGFEVLSRWGGRIFFVPENCHLLSSPNCVLDEKNYSPVDNCSDFRGFEVLSRWGGRIFLILKTASYCLLRCPLRKLKHRIECLLRDFLAYVLT